MDVSTGLREEEVAARLARDGPNVIPPAPRPPAWHDLLGQMTHFFAVMLWAAGLLAVVGGLPQLGAAIFVVILVNGLFAFVEEHRAEAAAERLRDLMPQRVTVLRAGYRVQVDVASVVIDDLVLLDAGDRVPADGTLLRAASLEVDASMLTGESVPERPGPGDRVWAGTFVVEGEGAVRVDAIGAATRLAGLAELTRAIERPTSPLQHELQQLVRTIAVIAVGVGVVFFGLSVALGSDPQDGFVFAIGVTVALVPEALLPTVTLSLAVGAQRMARQRALVRRLESVETLGSATFICTDKTGTLTMNQMELAEIWTPEGSTRLTGFGYEPTGLVDADSTEARIAAGGAVAAALACSTGRVVDEGGRWVAHGDPMEAAIDAAAMRLDAPKAAGPVVARFPFDPRRRRMSVVTGPRVVVKGAPDALLPICAPVAGATEALHRLGGNGLRVLAVGERPVGPAVPADAGEAERDLVLVCLLGFDDPPRPHARDALHDCHRAGVRVVMVTGDDPRTAAAVADEVGMLGPEPVVTTGADLPSDDRQLGDLLDRDGVVVARVAPEDKLRIARVLQERGHVVAMTGDGVNDGPALQEADIGVAMGRSGSDVAREAADLVLLDDDFATLVTAIEQGRATFLNTRRFLTYHLTDNVAELAPLLVWALSATRFPLALGVLQILALDLATDTLSAVALGAEAPSASTLDRPPVSGRLLTRRVAVRAFGLLGPTEACCGFAAFLVTLLAAGWRPGDDFPTGKGLAAASGAYFLAVVLGQGANAFACRSSRVSPWRLGWFSNRLLVVAVGVALATALVLLYVPFLAAALDQAGPTLAGWLTALLAVPAVLTVDAVAKARWARRPGDS